MKSCVVALNEYFEKWLPHLDKIYEWDIPASASDYGFLEDKDGGYWGNVRLKEHLSRRWSQGDRLEQRRLAEFIVKDWGGVKGNKKETIDAYVDEILSGKISYKFYGVASYSKILSIVNVEEYAIYDARVAACLNAVQYGKVSSGLAFNYPAGRNSVTGNVGKKEGFSQVSQFKVVSLVSCGWQRIERDNTYKTYLDVLKKCSQGLGGKRIQDLEMILFANAEIECSRVMSSVGVG